MSDSAFFFELVFTLVGFGGGFFALLYGGAWLYRSLPERGKSILANGFALCLVLIVVGPLLLREVIA